MPPTRVPPQNAIWIRLEHCVLAWRIPGMVGAWWAAVYGVAQSQTRLKRLSIALFWGLPRWLSGKESTCQCRRHRRPEFDPLVGKISWRRKWQPTPVFLPGKSHGQRSLVVYSPWGCKRVKHNLATNQQQNHPDI